MKKNRCFTLLGTLFLFSAMIQARPEKIIERYWERFEPRFHLNEEEEHARKIF